MIKNMPASGVIVISIIAILFVLAVILLFYVRLRYRLLEGKASGTSQESRGFRSALLSEYTAAYKQFGQNVNTPAIITDVVSSRLGGLLLCERFLNNAVSLFVTLGLFGTFLGLSMSVTSLTELIGYSNTSEWLSVLDSVGGGLMSALSGMGVAFYTSLVGVACSIILTILRSIFSVQNARDKLETRLELWLDHEVAPTLPTEAPKDDADLVHQMVLALNKTSDELDRTLKAAAADMDKTLKGATEELKTAIAASRTPIAAMNKTVENFNTGVRDFSEFNYNLRGTVERMDVAVRDLVAGLREVSRSLERSGRS